jgi:hypothetical protein
MRCNTSRIRRWGRARLPNGQVARSLWSERRRMSQKIRVSRNVKVCITSTWRISRLQHMTPDHTKWAARIWRSSVLFPCVCNGQSRWDTYCPCPCLSLLTSNPGTLGRVVQYIVGMRIQRCRWSSSCPTVINCCVHFRSATTFTTKWSSQTLVHFGEVRPIIWFYCMFIQSRRWEIAILQSPNWGCIDASSNCTAFLFSPTWMAQVATSLIPLWTMAMVWFTYVPPTLCKRFLWLKKRPIAYPSCKNVLIYTMNNPSKGILFCVKTEGDFLHDMTKFGQTPPKMTQMSV